MSAKGKKASKAEHYTYTVTWEPEDEVFVGRVAEFDLLAAHGNTPAAALKEIEFVVGAVIEDLEESGKPVPEPFSHRHYSGKTVLRMSQQLHRTLAQEAAAQGVSLNDWINHKLLMGGTATINKQGRPAARPRKQSSM